MGIEEINSYLREQLWMDFEATKIGANILELHGYIDESCNDCILIRFRDVYAVNITTRFSYEGKGDFISIIDGNRAYTLNSEYEVPIGNRIFRLLRTNIPTEMFIIANNIELEVIK